MNRHPVSHPHAERRRLGLRLGAWLRHLLWRLVDEPVAVELGESLDLARQFGVLLAEWHAQRRVSGDGAAEFLFLGQAALPGRSKRLVGASAFFRNGVMPGRDFRDTRRGGCCFRQDRRPRLCRFQRRR